MRAGKIAAWVAALVLVALYAYALIAAIGNLTGMVTYMSALLGPLPWTILLAGVVVPVLSLAIALWIGRGRSAGMRLLLLATGLCVTAAMELQFGHFMTQLQILNIIS